MYYLHWYRTISTSVILFRTLQRETREVDGGATPQRSTGAVNPAEEEAGGESAAAIL